MSMGTKVFAASGSHDQIAATPVHFIKPTRVDNQSVISVTATTLITANAATDKLRTSAAATLTRANAASLTSATLLINATVASLTTIYTA